MRAQAVVSATVYDHYAKFRNEVDGMTVARRWRLTHHIWLRDRKSSPFSRLVNSHIKHMKVVCNLSCLIKSSEMVKSLILYKVQCFTPVDVASYTFKL